MDLIESIMSAIVLAEMWRAWLDKEVTLVTTIAISLSIKARLVASLVSSWLMKLKIFAS